MTTRSDYVAACLVALMSLAMCWGVRYVFTRPVSLAVSMPPTEHPHLP